MAILTENIREKLAEMFGVISEEEGFKIFDIKLAHRNAAWDIKVVLDRLDGYVTINDCARLSKRFAARLELERLITGKYKLEVSSPGLDRPLRNRNDYERFKGKQARLVIAGPSGTDVLVGRIASVEEDSVTLSVEEDEKIINYRTIKKANLEVEIPGFSEPKMRSRRKKKDKRKSR
jgi:ribosome maturation factor RimP